jgi:hypothetical protein
MSGTHWRVFAAYDPDVEVAFERALREAWDALGEDAAPQTTGRAAHEEAFVLGELRAVEQALELYGHDMDPSQRAQLDATRDRLRAALGPRDEVTWKQALRRYRDQRDPYGPGSILDMERVLPSEDVPPVPPHEVSTNFGCVRIASPDELLEAFGTPTPTRADVDARPVAELRCALGEGVVYPIHDDEGAPVGWVFEGLSGL